MNNDLILLQKNTLCKRVPSVNLFTAGRRLLQRSTLLISSHVAELCTRRDREPPSRKPNAGDSTPTVLLLGYIERYGFLTGISILIHNFWRYTRMASMLFQRKQVLPLILILILVLGAQATLIAASRVPREKSQLQGRHSASLTSMPGASGCTSDPNNPGGRCPNPWRFLEGMCSFETMFICSFFPLNAPWSSGAQTWRVRTLWVPWSIFYLFLCSCFCSACM